MTEPGLNGPFLPGTNLNGAQSGANWTFALPSLELDQVLCLGCPTAASLRTLSRVGRHVVVVPSSKTERETVSAAVRRHALTNVAVIVRGPRDELPLPDAGVDLVFVSGAGDLRRMSGRRRWRAECRRVLKPQGRLYFERRGPFGIRLRERKLQKALSEFGPAAALWLTPLAGEGQTAVAAFDRQTIRYFLSRRLDSPSVTPQLLRRLWRGEPERRTPNSGEWRGREGETERGGERETETGKSGTNKGRVLRPSFPLSLRLSISPSRIRSLARRSLRSRVVRGSGRAAIKSCQLLERLCRGSRLMSRVVRRCGVMVGGTSEPLFEGPPRYLQAVAEEAGIDVSRHRWGLAAGEGYESRKLLFFLFAPESETPEFVVKMTRAPRYNGRLQRECRALRLLHERKLASRETLPEVAFSGTHGGLAIVGETTIDGVPFRQCSQARPGCPYAGSAIGWLTELGGATARLLAATPVQIAERLEGLLRQFDEIYRPEAPYRRFLERQIDALAESASPVPVVFQHGDPGCWNVLVTKSGRSAFLDWESADPQGLPLWDLLYFLRSFSVGASRRRKRRPEEACRHFLGQSPLSSFLFESTRQYCRRVGIAPEAVPPLFYTCWMHRALKEATRLPPGRLKTGHYARFLYGAIDGRYSPGLKRLFA